MNHEKSKITKIPNSEENSKRKVPNQMAKQKISNASNVCITTVMFLTWLWYRHFLVLKVVKMNTKSDETHQSDMYTLQSIHIPNIVDLLLILSQIRTWPRNFNLDHLSMKWGNGQVKLRWRVYRRFNEPIYQIQLFYFSLGFISSTHWTMQMRSRTMYMWRTETS